MTGVFLLLGGIGLFLYGINFMSRSLEDAAGDNLRVILGKTTSNSVLAVLVGLFVTALIQSSGATSVMCAGFVDSGIMELSSALFAMLGATAIRQVLKSHCIPCRSFPAYMRCSARGMVPLTIRCVSLTEQKPKCRRESRTI